MCIKEAKQIVCKRVAKQSEAKLTQCWCKSYVHSSVLVILEQALQWYFCKLKRNIFFIRLAATKTKECRKSASSQMQYFKLHCLKLVYFLRVTFLAYSWRYTFVICPASLRYLKSVPNLWRQRHHLIFKKGNCSHLSCGHSYRHLHNAVHCNSFTWLWLAWSCN